MPIDRWEIYENLLDEFIQVNGIGSDTKTVLTQETLSGKFRIFALWEQEN